MNRGLKFPAALMLLGLQNSLKKKWGEWREKSRWFRWLTDDWSPQQERWMFGVVVVAVSLSIVSLLCFVTSAA